MHKPRRPLADRTIIVFLLCCFFFIAYALSSPFPLFAAPPQRIISLAPNVTEILFAMGLGDRIAGVTQFCDYPEEAKKKTKVGGMSNPSLEAVISLKPDIVVLTTDGNPKEFEEKLRSLKIRTYVFRSRRLTELPAGIRELGAALEVPDKAEALAKKIEDTLTNTSLRHVRTQDKKKILFVVWPEPLIVAGSGTVINDTLALFGQENIAARAKTAYPKYSVEEVIRQSPDIIFIGKGHTDIRKMSEGFLKKIAIVPAVKNGKVFFLSDNLYRMGPRILKGIEEMAACLK
jgi:iron complex transport system substrate-binding protein